MIVAMPHISATELKYLWTVKSFLSLFDFPEHDTTRQLVVGSNCDLWNGVFVSDRRAGRRTALSCGTRDGQRLCDDDLDVAVVVYEMAGDADANRLADRAGLGQGL